MTTPTSHQPAQRQQVLFIHAAEYRARTGLSHERWAEAVDEAYCRLVPVEQRSVAAPGLAVVTGAEDYRKLLRAWDQLLRRYTDGGLRFPSELEEAWLEAMAEPWRSACRRELARRVGLWGAARRADGGPGDGTAWGAVMVDFGELSPAMCRLLEDGRLDVDDAADAPAVITQIERAPPDLESLRQRLMALSGEATPLRSVR